jgi:hypothetical protein
MTGIQYRYMVELRRGSGDATFSGILATPVQAKDRFEAIAMARRHVERQYPHIDLAKIDTWFIPRRLD